MRVFIAIEFYDGLKNYLCEKQLELMRYCVKGNFTHKENFHLTLRFIGEVELQELEKLKKAIIDTARDYRPFELALDGLGQFPKGNKKVLWIGTKSSSNLSGLYKTLEKYLVQQGYLREEREYNPHITLARQVVTGDMGDLWRKVVVEPQKITVKGISLMESTRVHEKLTYRRLYNAVFAE